MLSDLMNPTLTTKFEYQYGKLLLVVQDQKSTNKKTYDLVSLFQQTNLSHIKIDSTFLSFFLKRCNEFKFVDFEKPMDEKTCKNTCFIYSVH